MKNKNNLDYIIKKYYHAKNHLFKGSEFDLDRALIGIDNSLELSLKLYFKLGKSSGFYNCIKKLENLGILSSNSISIIKNYHKLRNELYHEPIQTPINSELYDYAYVFEEVLFKLFNRNPNCLFMQLDNEPKTVDKFFKNWNKIEKNLALFYTYEGDIYNPPDLFYAWINLANYQGIIDDDEFNYLEQIREFIKRLFEGKISNPIDSIKDYLLELKKIKSNLRTNIIYYFENYDARLR